MVVFGNKHIGLTCNDVAATSADDIIPTLSFDLGGPQTRAGVTLKPHDLDLDKVRPWTLGI